MATEAEMRLHRCCFTGHRPFKLNMPERKIEKALEKEIKQAIDDGFTTFITGMAPGVDIIAAEIVLRLQKKHDIKLICASPFEGFERTWKDEWQPRYKKVLEQGDLVKYVCDHYYNGCFQTRNVWMVDHSARVIAAWNGEPSGTKNTIDYANKVGIEVRNVIETE